jgi:hypothetical protein
MSIRLTPGCPRQHRTVVLFLGLLGLVATTSLDCPHRDTECIAALTAESEWLKVQLLQKTVQQQRATIAEVIEDNASALARSEKLIEDNAMVVAARSEEANAILFPVSTVVDSGLPTTMTNFPYRTNKCQQWTGLPTDPKKLDCGVFVFLHIAKTGGSSIREHLQAKSMNSSWDFEVIYTDLTPNLMWNETDAWHNSLKILDQSCPRLILEVHQGAPGMGEYMLENVFKPMAAQLQAKGASVVFATMLREPIAYELSRAYYVRWTHKEFLDNMESNIHSLRNWLVKYILIGRHGPTDTFEARSILDGANGGGGENTVHSVKQVLSNFDLVGRTEELAKFVDALNLVLGFTGAAPDENSTPEGWKFPVTHEDLAKLTKLNKLDIQLYESFCSK